MISQYGGTEKVEAASLCAVYDPRTGQIHHWHHCITIVGGRHPSNDEIGADALAAVMRGNREYKSELKVIHVDPALDRGKEYRVDHERQSLAVRTAFDIEK